MAIETPNGVEFSAAAKLYLCASRFIKPAGMLMGYPTPAGQKVHMAYLADGIVLVTLDWLEQNQYAQIWQDTRKMLMGSTPVVVVKALYSEAPGFSGRFLQATHWENADLIKIMDRLLRIDRSPLIPFLDDISTEFVQAGILTRGGYGAHGNVWDAQWLEYLLEAWSPEVYDFYNRALSRPDRAVAERNIGHAVAASQPRDDDDGISFD